MSCGSCNTAIESSSFFEGSYKVVDCCRLRFCDADGKVLCEINLTNVNIYCTASGSVGLDDGVSKKTFNETDAQALGFADLAALQAYVEAQRAECCENIEDPLPDSEIVCVEENDNLYVVCIDKNVSPPLITVKDFAGNDVTGTVTPKACQGLTFETETCDFCVDGVNFRRVDCIKKDKDGLVLGIDTFWQDITGAVVPDPTLTATVVTKGFCQLCDPKWESFTGNNATLTAFNKLSLFIPACCSVTIKTDAGVITLPAQNGPWNFCEEFGCDLTAYSIAVGADDTCTVEDITTILTKTK